MPNLTLAAPSDAQELRDLLHTSLQSARKGPFVIRFPKGAVTEDEPREPAILPIGEWEVLRKGTGLLLLATGKMVEVASAAASLLDGHGIHATLINARYIKPLDQRLYDWAAQHNLVVTVEDNIINGGFGSAVGEVLASLGVPLISLGVPSTFIPQGTQAELLQQLGLTPEGICERVRREIERLDNTREPQRLSQPGL
jgi:1-deoxy-D-xylulose-5-phosphate synthase